DPSVRNYRTGLFRDTRFRKRQINIAFFAVPCREVCICSSSPTCPANVTNATLGMGGWWLDLTQQGLSPCKIYKTSWRSSVKSYQIIESAREPL
ncbi:MAG TPA: hypothetical protein VFD10_04090, partial [Atribacterota bacterium]|nr:hypothetical protein [Atribacterota bacterium]